MITFKQYRQIQESSDDLDQFHKDIDDHIQNGEIVKPRFDELKAKIDRHVRTRSQEIQRLHLDLPHEQRDANSEGTYWDAPDNLHSVASYAKKVAKLDQSHPVVQAASKFVSDHMKLHDKMKTLKGMIVTTAKKREEVKVAKAADMQRKFADSSSLIKTLTKHRDEFIQRARDKAEEHFKYHLDILSKGGGIDAVAPRPVSSMGRDAYRTATYKRDFYKNLMSKPLAAHIDEAATGADHSYQAWVEKITQKIGKPVTTSDMKGSPWTGSNITVKCSDGEEQVWHTQMIINYSKYNKAFNQFPTRRVS